MTQSVMRGVLVAVVLLASGCSVVETQGSLLMFGRNPSGLAIGVQVDSATSGGWSVLGGYGCQTLGVPWTISIGASGPDGAEGQYTPLLTSGDLADPIDAQIWIEADEDGTVTWGEGIPDWAPADAPSC